MSQQLANGKQQFIDGNGNPLAGGSVAFYLPGTLTPTNTWKDPALTTLNANPVVLDANGMASIWGADGTQYRQVVQDALGNTIWDEVVGLATLASALSVQEASYTNASDSGAVNAYAISLTPPAPALTPGMIVAIDNIVASNTGACTLNVNGLGALPIQLPGGVALSGGEMVATYGALLRLNHGGTAWTLLVSTGAVVGPTPAAGDYSNRLATTQSLGNVGITRFAEKSANYAISTADAGTMFYSTAAVTYTLPAAASATGSFFGFQNNTQNTPTINTAASNEKLISENLQVTSIALSKADSQMIVQSDGANWIVQSATPFVNAQNVAPVFATQAAGSSGSSGYTVSASITAPRAGYVIALGKWIGTGGTTPSVALAVNGTQLASDQGNSYSQPEFGIYPLTQGQVASATLTVGTTSTSNNASLTLIFVPAN